MYKAFAIFCLIIYILEGFFSLVLHETFLSYLRARFEAIAEFWFFDSPVFLCVVLVWSLYELLVVHSIAMQYWEEKAEEIDGEEEI